MDGCAKGDWDRCCVAISQLDPIGGVQFVAEIFLSIILVFRGMQVKNGESLAVLGFRCVRTGRVAVGKGEKGKGSIGDRTRDLAHDLFSNQGENPKRESYH